MHAMSYLQLHEHEAYRGDRTKEALLAFADNLVPSAGAPHKKHMHLESVPKGSGCNLAGLCTHACAFAFYAACLLPENTSPLLSLA